MSRALAFRPIGRARTPRQIKAGKIRKQKSASEKATLYRCSICFEQRYERTGVHESSS